jgi:hypothetical protein
MSPTHLDDVLRLVGALLVLAVPVLLGLRRTRVRAAAERAALQDGLQRSQEQVEALSRRVEDLGDEVRTAQQATDLAAADREYVITTLHQATLSTDEPAQPLAHVPLHVEERLVEGLGRIDRASLVGRRVVEAGVSVIATVHGVRRALQAEHLDRAAAEAHVARRRSRRQRRQELREAKRLLRAVKAQRPSRVGEERVA